MNTTDIESSQTPVLRLVNWLKSASGIMIIISICAAIFATIHRGPFVLVNAVSLGGMLALMAMGLAICFLIMNIPNFAYGEFFMIGTLASYYVFTPINKYLISQPNAFLSAIAPVAAIFAATIVGAIAGAIIEIVIFSTLRERNRKNWTMNCFALTLGISVILIYGHQLIFGTRFKGITRYWDRAPISVAQVSISVERIFAFMLSLVVIIMFWLFLKYNRHGKAMRAVAEDEAGALMVGINYNRIMTVTMSMTAAMAALAGATLLFMYPSTPTVGTQPLSYSWFVIILVGMGNISGAIAGGFIVALLQVLTRVYIGEGLEFLVPSLIVIIILVIKPSGIFGAKVRGIWDK